MSDYSIYEAAFRPVRQAVVGISGDKIVFANPAAIAVLGEDLYLKSTQKLFPDELLSNPAQNFILSSKLAGKNVSILVNRQGSIDLLYIDFEESGSGSLVLTRSMLSNMRNCATGIKIAADRCFDKIETAAFPDEKLVSILYHYYYRLVRTILQLDYADKLERREMAFSPSQTDLVGLISALSNTLGSLIGYPINFSTACPKLIAMVDSDLLEILLLNMVSNSMKFSGENREISISIKDSQDNAIITIDDKGIGLSREKLSRIFSLPDDDSNAMSPEEGLGLGLYISHSVVALHNGVMLVESRPNEGVHIRILLPKCIEGSSTLNSPGSPYQTSGMSTILTGLADVLPSDCYGRKFED